MPAAHDPIVERLRNPASACGIEELARSWHQVDCVASVKGYGKLIADPGLPGRIRGGFGKLLLMASGGRSASGEPSGFSPPSAFDILFRKHGRLNAAFEMASPWVLNVDAVGADLAVTLSLFGFACDYAQVAGEFLSLGLRRDINLRGASELFLPGPEVISREIVLREPPEADLPIRFLDEETGELLLHLLSPVAIHGNSVLARPESLLTTFPARLAGLARWHDLELRIDRDAVLREIRALQVHWIDAHRVAWQRGSRRQDKTLYMGEAAGELLLSGPLQSFAELAPMLALAERAHIGADTAFGCGRFQFN